MWDLGRLLGAWYPGCERVFSVGKPLTVGGKAIIVGMEFKKPWHIFGVEVLQNAPLPRAFTDHISLIHRTISSV